MAKQYYTKVLFTCNNNTPAYQRIIRVFADNEEQAEANLDKIVANWSDIEYYWVRQITIDPFDLKLYIVQILLHYTRKSKTIKLKMHLEDPEEAKEFFTLISEDWNNLKDFRILKTTAIK